MKSFFSASGLNLGRFFKYCSDKTAELPGHSSDGHMRMFPLPEFVELSREPVLCLDGDSHDLRRLSLATAVENQINRRSTAIVPGRFYQDSSGMAVAGFCYGSTMLSLT